MDESTETIEVREAGGTARLGKAVTVAVIIAVALLVIGGVLIYSAVQEPAGTRLRTVYLIAALMPLAGALCAMLALVAPPRAANLVRCCALARKFPCLCNGLAFRPLS